MTASVAQQRAKRFATGLPAVAIAKATPRILQTTAFAASLPEKTPVTHPARIARQPWLAMGFVDATKPAEILPSIVELVETAARPLETYPGVRTLTSSLACVR